MVQNYNKIKVHKMTYMTNSLLNQLILINEELVLRLSINLQPWEGSDQPGDDDRASWSSAPLWTHMPCQGWNVKLSTLDQHCLFNRLCDNWHLCIECANILKYIRVICAYVTQQLISSVASEEKVKNHILNGNKRKWISLRPLRIQFHCPMDVLSIIIVGRRNLVKWERF